MWNTRLRRLLTTVSIVAIGIGGVAVPAAAGGGPPPIDTSGPTDTDPWLGWNPAFLEVGYGIAAIDCQLPQWNSTPAGMTAIYQAYRDCHDAAWRGTVEHFGYEFRSPRLWSGTEGAGYDGACGSNSTGREAFYCDLDETIVMPYDSMKTIANYGPGYALAVFSHEYGHHLQELFGVIDAYAARRNAAGWQSAGGQLLSRQLELQAWCLSGMFYGVNTGRGSINQALSDAAFDNNSHAGDRPGELREHGTNENIAIWFGWGRHPSEDPNADVAPSLYECNPWAARTASTLE